MPFIKRMATPHGAAIAVFLLVIASCLFLVFGREKGGSVTAVSPSGKWTCSMCPQFILPEPGKCPKCFMDLIPLDEGAQGGTRIELLLPHDAAQTAGITIAVAEAYHSPHGDSDETAPVLVPATAVLQNRGRAFVFVESDEGEHLVYTMREVELAGREGDARVVAAGLDEGEAVAATGVFRIDSAMQILGKISLVSLPDGDLAAAADPELPPYQPAERASVDLRAGVVAVDDWFAAYEALRAALAKDEINAAAQPSSRLADSLSVAAAVPDADFSGIHQRLAEAAGTLSRADGLEAKRAAFEKVTAEMVLMARKYGSPGGGLNLVFCPMAFGGTGAYWLQPGQTVDNPYHGLEMPLCGWLVDSIPPYDANADDPLR